MDVRLRDTTIDGIVAAQAVARPTAVAIECSGATLSYGELEVRAQAFAHWMLEHGVVPGDHVALWLPNGISWAVAHVAVAITGAVAVPVSTRLTTPEAAFIVEHSESTVVVVAERFLGRAYADEARDIVMGGGRPRVEVVAVDPDAGALPAAAVRAGGARSTADATAVVQYTSGTTGRPKGCVLSHRAWTNNAWLSARLAGVSASDVVFSPSPFFHLFGSLTGFMGALTVGARFVTVPTFRADEAAEVIASSSATHMVAVPTVWLDLMQAPHVTRLRSLRGGVWGGGTFPPRALEHATAPDGLGLQLNAIYGMTEAPTLTQVRPDDPHPARLATVGRPTPHVDVAILDPATGDELGAGTVGEICAQGYNRALGYLKDPAAMQRRMRQGWLRTGDLGSLDAEGFLTVRGRLTDMVVTGGANVYAREVEDAIQELEQVVLVAVVAKPDDRLGEVPVAWVSADAGARLTPQAVVDRCRAVLAPYKVPRHVFIIPEMPLTESGKIHKARLVEMTREHDQQQGRA